MQGSNVCSFSSVTTKLGMREMHNQPQTLDVHEVPGKDRSYSCSPNELRSKTRESRKYDSRNEGQMAAKKWSRGQHFSVSVPTVSRGKIVG